MRQIASGKTVSRIARELSLSVRTISTYRARILEKMCLGSNAALKPPGLSHYPRFWKLFTHLLRLLQINELFTSPENRENEAQFLWFLDVSAGPKGKCDIWKNRGNNRDL